MKKENKIWYNAEELSKMLGVSLGHSYKLIRRLNKELEKQNYIIVAGKIPVKYFEKRYYGYGA